MVNEVDWQKNKAIKKINGEKKFYLIEWRALIMTFIFVHVLISSNNDNKNQIEMKKNANKLKL